MLFYVDLSPKKLCSKHCFRRSARLGSLFSSPKLPIPLCLRSSICATMTTLLWKYLILNNADQDYVNNDLIIKWQQDKGKNESRLKRLLVSKQMTWLYYPMTVWWLPDDCLITAWWLPDDQIYWWLSDDYLMTVWWLPDDCLMTAWWPLEDRLKKQKQGKAKLKAKLFTKMLNWTVWWIFSYCSVHPSSVLELLRTLLSFSKSNVYFRPGFFFSWAVKHEHMFVGKKERKKSQEKVCSSAWLWSKNVLLYF